MIDENKNNIPDKIEHYTLFIISLFLIIFGFVGVCLEWFSETFGQWIIVIGIGGLIGDEFIKRIVLRK